MSTCRSCGAEIVWATTADGKKIPLDPEPHPEGNVEIYEGTAIVRGGKPVQPMMHNPPMYLTHFVTCPDAPEWRKR